jgi:hypothetical protein
LITHFKRRSGGRLCNEMAEWKPVIVAPVIADLERPSSDKDER